MEFVNNTGNAIKVVKSDRKGIKTWQTIQPGKSIITENKVFAESYTKDGFEKVEEKAVVGKIGTKKVETKMFKRKK